MFRDRADFLRDDLRVAARTHAGPQRILVSGSSGLVGTALCALLTTGGHDVVRLVRDRKLAGNPAFRCWDPAHGQISVADLEQFDAVIHLGGEGIADGRWSPEKKRRLKDSRVIPTRLLCESLAKCERPPKVVVVASATGYYGDRGDELLTEQSDLGNGFLPEICRAWEEATSPVSAAGIRTVNVRIGVVLTPAGGALAKMLPIFRWGGGGRLGNGRQWMSVISLDDLIGLIGHALVHPELSGPVNAVLPEPVTNAEFTRTLGRVLHRPAMLPVPKTAIRIVAGEMADALLFASTRAVPQRALESGYQFRHATLEQALRHVLGAQPPTSEHQTDCSCVTHAE